MWHWKINQQRLLLTKVIFVLLNQIMVIGIYGKLCEVETGQNNIIVDIEESRGNVINSQENSPKLAIHGEVDDEITLGLNLPEGSHNLFKLNGKFLQLVHPLDRDKENLSHIQFSISCTIKSTPSRTRNIPIIVRVTDVNDESPQFVNTPYETSIPESTPVGTTIFKDIKAIDIDAGVNGAVEYFLVEGAASIINFRNDSKNSTLINAVDGFGVFAISYPHQGHVTVVKTLDYERVQRYYLTIVASDRARNLSERLSATTTLIINIEDVDDLDPSFIYKDCLFFEGSCINPEYIATIIPGTVQKNLEIMPQSIKAVDLDALNASIKYSFIDGTPNNYNDYFEIDEKTAEIHQIKLVDSTVSERQFVITIKAEEMTGQKRFTTAKLIINVKPVDVYPPVLIASSLNGLIEENAPFNTRVMSLINNNPIKFGIKDEDYSTDIELPIYSFELTTNSFAVNKDGYLIVNDSAGIDREKSDKLLFQVIAREIHGNVASSPLSVVVTILDINDNKPEIFEMQPVTISAGNSRRLLTQAIAKDIDAGLNASITFSISTFDIKEKFTIDSKTGEIYAIGRLNANENYNLTIRATDGGELFSETDLQINVIAGPNTKPPIFTKNIYEVNVSESSNINSTVVIIHADDPETDPVKYTIISGNDLRQFKINADTGAITIIRKLDRETLTKYQLLVRAEDFGGLYSTAVVNLKVLDVNDNKPLFDESTLPYLFSVDEGKLNAYVGMVQAYDIDEGINGDVIYSLPQNVPFRINSETGEIYTKEKLNFKKQNEYEFMVKASDHAPVPLFSEIRIKIAVKEVSSVLPLFNKTTIEVKIPENVPDAFVLIAQINNPESVDDVNYVIKKNSAKDLFKIDSKTGEIRIKKELDFEEKSKHELIVGTAENDGENPGDILKIKILVEDRNDIAPVFLIESPEPISITDDQAVGSLITSMPAVDTDATSPGNVVRYEMTGKGKALKFFHIDPENGNIRIKDDLSKDTAQQYEINVRAYDLGEPQLSSISNLIVFVKHVQQQFKNNIESTTVTVQNSVEELGLSFGDDEEYVTNIPESTSTNATIKLIPIFNVKKLTRTKSGFSCEIIAGNELNIFKVAIEDLACAVKLREPLDFENKTTHELKIKLQSNKQRVIHSKSIATLKIFVSDVNDNEPAFKFRYNDSSSSKRFVRNDTYYGIVNYESMIGTTVLKVEAYDEDSGTFGLIKYRLMDAIDVETSAISKDELPSSFFIITDTGVIRTRKPLHKVIDGHFMFKVEAIDNYGKDAGIVHRSYARVVINVISDFNRLTVAISGSNTNEVQRYKQKLEEILTEKTNGLLVTIEKFSNRKAMTKNGSIIELNDSTDTWFYVIDPKTEKVLLRNSSVLANSLLDINIQTQVIAAISRLVRSPVDGIFAPLETENEIHHLEISNSQDSEYNLVFYSLISLAMVASIIVIIGGVYSFIWWNKYHRSKSSQSTSIPNHRNQLRVDNNKINQLQNVHAVQVNLKELIVAYDGSSR
ncbi:hypothetical protein PVAND_003676 [Polypedilum vanderplanki]|uniref:Cadherin domain-containing protein n=1 Tax=Polypedilum vanderplanki TaxID=319348 RepID=A0A9J6BVB2_POLVA|nr:hypothetical protein PVAND_003676 [Polypedilum vanderplanki]